MNAAHFLKNPNLAPYVREVNAGEYLFEQGQKAETMFLILKGTIRLIGEDDLAGHVTHRLEEGQILGERVIATSSDYPRALSAVAETDVKVLEFSLRDFQRLQIKEPLLASLIFKNIVQILLRRFDERNFVVRLPALF